jgi:hypothetical protein
VVSGVLLAPGNASGRNATPRLVSLPPVGVEHLVTRQVMARRPLKGFKGAEISPCCDLSNGLLKGPPPLARR